MKTKIFFLFSVALFLPVVALAETDHLVISQVQITGGVGYSDNDFVEIFNPTSHDIDLNGLFLVKRTSKAQTDDVIKTWTQATIVPPYSYFLLAHPSYVSISPKPDASFEDKILLSNDTGIALRSGGVNTGVIDSLVWGTVSNGLGEGSPAKNPGANKALARQFSTDNAILDSENNSLDFKSINSSPHNLASSPNPPHAPEPPADTPPAETPPAENLPAEETPEQTSVPTFSKDVIISEILPNPDGADNGEEWIELYNNFSEDVDLSGWIIDDESTEGSIGKDAYIFPEGSTIKASLYSVINLPEEVFALNNTGGDTVRLFWPDQTLVTAVAYTGNVKEDTTYAMKSSGVYEWTTLVTKGTKNQFPDNFLANVTSNAETKIKFNEILPNPKGPDSGGEWIEVKNSGTEPIYIHNWILDDGNPTDSIGSSAYKIQSPTISPGGLAVIVIPAGKFALNNTTDTVRLFNANKVLIDSVTYEGAKEGLSYALIDGKWVWSDPTPNAINNTTDEAELAPPASIVINELFPDPDKTNKQEEFIELLNTGSVEVDLSGFILADLATVYKLESKIKPGEFLVIKKSESKIALNNYGKETVTLTDPKGQIVSVVEYEDAPQDKSYNLNLAGSYVWSAKLTPGTANLVSTQASQGLVKGATLPRTGNDSPINQSTIFVLWAIIWYIYISFTNNKKHTYEQTRID